MKKIQMVPGKRYKGYAYLNEFGQIHFDPSQIGSRSEAKKLVTEKDDFSVYETKNFIVLHVRLVKILGVKEKVKSFLNVVNDILTILREYDF